MLGAEVDARAAGFLLAVGLPIRPGGRCFGSIYVQPWARGRGVGSELRARLLPVVHSYGSPGILVPADEDPRTLAVVEHWGYPVVGRHYESQLDLTTIDDAAVAAAVRPLAALGIELSLLGDGQEVLESDLRAVYPFFADRFREAPDASGSTADMPFPVFAGFVIGSWRLLLAWRHGTLVGLTGVALRDSGTVNTFFTGVHPDHRGLGIAVALKSKHAQILRDRGYRRLTTQNMDVNAHILAANERLGFRRLHTYLDVQIDVGPNAEPTPAG
jgi:GNAT superfamily N-acetyltransferase